MKFIPRNLRLQLGRFNSKSRIYWQIPVVALVAAFVNPALAQSYPNKPVRVLIGYSPGGPTDLAARMVVQDIGPRLSQSFVVENRPGAGGLIAVDALLASPADGYTISPLATPIVVASILAGRAADPTTAFSAIGFLWDSAFPIEINPAAPLMGEVRTIKDLLAVAKANPGKINYTSAGTGSYGHLFGVRLASEAGVQMTHVGYKGNAPASVDVMAGRIQVMVGGVANDDELIKAGKVRILAVTGATRDPRHPNIPSISEAGFPSIAVTTWGGLVAPFGTPKSAIDLLASELRTTMQKSEIQSKMATITGLPFLGGPQEFGTRIAKDYRELARIVKEANLKLE